MSQEKYIGMDVHQATISVSVTDPERQRLECTPCSKQLRTPLRD
jgi:hypothetical protein